MDASTDQELVHLARTGNLDAYGAVVLRYQESVFNVCYRILQERREAEDLAQETFLRAHSRLHLYDAERPFGPWIRRVAANLCLNHLESPGTNLFPLADEENTVSPAPTVESISDNRETANQIQKALNSLPPRYRVIIELRHFQELSYGEIAETLNLPISDVKSHLFRARKILAEKLNETSN